MRGGLRRDGAMIQVVALSFKFAEKGFQPLLKYNIHPHSVCPVVHAASCKMAAHFFIIADAFAVVIFGRLLIRGVFF